MNTLFAAARGKTSKRRICFPITSRAYYGRSQLLLKKLHRHPDLELELMLGGSILLDKYSRHIAEDIEAGGFTISASLFNVIEGDEIGCHIITITHDLLKKLDGLGKKLEQFSLETVRMFHGDARAAGFTL